MHNLGNATYALGQYAKALEYYQQSLSVARQLGDYKVEVSSLNSLGNTYDSLGQYQKAIEFYRQASELKQTKLGEKQ